jgi:hypothetical protein
VTEQRERPAVLEFLSGLFAGIGVILLTFVITWFTTAGLEKILRYRGREVHLMALIWAILALGSGYLIFLYGMRQNRATSFTAGLVTAAALFLLLDAACWNFTFV